MSDPAEQALIVCIKLSNDEFGESQDTEQVARVEEALERAVEQGGAGAYDGNEVGDGYVRFFLYGADADQMLAAVRPNLGTFKFSAGSYALRRYGEPGAEEARVALA